MTNQDKDIEIEYCHDVILITVGDNQAEVIRLIRELNNQEITIKEIKKLISNLPCKVAECLWHRDKIIHYEEKFKSAGAVIKFEVY